MMGAYGLLPQKGKLPVAGQAGALPGERVDAGPEPVLARMIVGYVVAAAFQGLVAVSAGFRKKIAGSRS